VDKCWIGVGHYCLKTEPKKKKSQFHQCMLITHKLNSNHVNLFIYFVFHMKKSPCDPDAFLKNKHLLKGNNCFLLAKHERKWAKDIFISKNKSRSQSI